MKIRQEPHQAVINECQGDPRLYQIMSLSGLLLYGTLQVGFEIPLMQAAVIVLVAQATQYVATRWAGLPAFDPRSALISSLSLCLLLRTNTPAIAAVAAVIAIGSKFVLRYRGKHVFNPTNLALVLAMASGDGWISPGQWGREAFFGFLVACVGGLVVNRSARSDVTYSFLGTYVSLLLARTWWLGDPWGIPFHQVQSGALLIFAFFMISDPKTTPDSRLGRVLFAAAVAAVAVVLQFGFYVPTGLMWALAGCAWLVPVLDRLLPGPRYEWGGTTRGSRGLRPTMAAHAGVPA